MYSTLSGPLSTNRKFGNRAIKRPKAKIMADLDMIFLVSPEPFTPASFLAPNAKGMATPRINKKKGKTQSVGVQPCQSACKRMG